MIGMRAIALFVSIAAPMAPGVAHAAGGMQTKPNKDFRELIAKGERPEIAACMAAAIDYARRDAQFNAIRWDQNISDQAVMRETDVDGRLTRFVHLTMQMRTRESGLFSETWRPVDVSCEQPEDGPLQVRVAPIVG
jgi:hypothetical protein